MTRKAIILLGPSAVGKGFISSIIEKFGYLTVGMSRLLEDRINKDSQFADDYIQMRQSGELLGDELVLETLFMFFDKNNEKNLILDGCTRRLVQLERVVEYLHKNNIEFIFLHLHATREECLNRMGIRVKETTDMGLTPRTDDLHESAQHKKLDAYFKNIPDILGYIHSQRFNCIKIDTNGLSKPNVAISVLSGLVKYNFL